MNPKNNLSSDQLKAKGNEQFATGKYDQAINFYDQAIKIDPTNAILYSNRAMANLKLEKYLHAQHDCSKAIELDGKLAKAYYRRGLANKNLNLYNLALKDFNRAISLSFNSSEIQKEIVDVEKIINSKKTIRIKPILKKDENLRSNKPLLEIPVEILDDTNKNINKDTNDEKSIVEKLHKNIEKMLDRMKPKNYVDFEKYWRELPDNNLKMKYLCSISVDDYKTIFEYPFESSLLFEILDIFSLMDSKHGEFIFQILDQAITQMPRFDLIISFLTPNEKSVITKLFEKLKQCYGQKLSSLEKKFNISL